MLEIWLIIFRLNICICNCLLMNISNLVTNAVSSARLLVLSRLHSSRQRSRKFFSVGVYKALRALRFTLLVFYEHSYSGHQYSFHHAVK